jgi:hypothetical protein
MNSIRIHTDSSVHSTNSTGPRIVSSHIPDLSDASISRFIERADIKPDSRILVSIPAGPNRTKNLVPALSLISKVTNISPHTTVVVDVAIDTSESVDSLLAKEIDTGLPSLEQLQQYLPLISKPPMLIRPRMQPVTNSVQETIFAMRDAASSGITHLIAPRTSRALSARITRGLKHYGPTFEGTELQVATAPSHDLVIDRASGHLKRKASEMLSFVISETAHFISPDLFEQLTERKGFFGAVARIAQKHKLKSF